MEVHSYILSIYIFCHCELYCCIHIQVKVELEVSLEVVDFSLVELAILNQPVEDLVEDYLVDKAIITHVLKGLMFCKQIQVSAANIFKCM